MNAVVSVNNQQTEIAPRTTLADLLSQWGYHPDEGMFAVAINSEFVPRGQYHSRLIQDRDLIDIVEPISGG